ncbi:MAG: hypothetical protein FWC20_03410 [Oscillospiraceae bacterium]|nr:hypothetical protein [Oscillospiraceae bacterium]MCL2278439.1 hypothetical protein [Oscillospiraceae bacterium]
MNIQTRASFIKESIFFFRTGRFFIVAAVIVGLAVFIPLLIAGMSAFMYAMSDVYDEMGVEVTGMTAMLSENSSVGVSSSASEITGVGLMVLIILLNRAAGGEQKKRTIIIPKSAGLRSFSYLFPKYIVYPLSAFALGFLAMLASFGISVLLFNTNDVLFLNLILAGLLVGSCLALFVCFHLTLGTATGQAGLSATVCIIAAFLLPLTFGLTGSDFIFNPFAMDLLASTTIMSGTLSGSEVMDIIFTILFAKGIMVVTFLIGLFAQNARRIDNSGNDKEL